MCEILHITLPTIKLVNLIGKGNTMGKEDLLKEYRKTRHTQANLRNLLLLQFDSISVGEDGTLILL